MARKYRPISRVDFHAAKAADAWREVAAVVREAAQAPGYGGPSLASVEKIADDIEQTREAVRVWLVEVASVPRRRRLRPAERAALAAALDARRGV